MEDEKRYSEQEAHQHFARALNGEVWRLLEKTERSPAEAEAMLHAAHASCYHWLQAGTPLHHQRGEWLIARVYTVLGLVEPALRHARRCLELTGEFDSLMQDFDLAFAQEGMARAHALAGNLEQARRHHQLAREFGLLIQEEEDRRIFEQELAGGDWHGLQP